MSLSPTTNHEQHHQLTVLTEDIGARLDLYLYEHIPGYSRTFFQKLIDQQLVSINNKIVDKHGYKVKANDHIQVVFPQAPEVPKLTKADIGVRVLFEHPDFLVLYKPAGIMVHEAPSAGEQVTLVDWLKAHFQEIAQVGIAQRPGIVHRLDKDTSGVIIIARTTQAHIQLSDMFKNREMYKEYLAIVLGKPEQIGTIEYPIARDPKTGHRMTHKIAYGRPATTHYEIQKYMPEAALILAHPITGRTHQIRVHFSAIGHPLLADKLYGTSSELIGRQALHAHSLSFIYQGHYFSISYGLPSDMQQAIAQLQAS